MGSNHLPPIPQLISLKRAASAYMVVFNLVHFAKSSYLRGIRYDL